jgi:pimeloyl-ACP methyl ester carboxylesterase
MRWTKLPLLSLILLLPISIDLDASRGLKIESCILKATGEEVLCGTYEVMENRQVRKGAKIRLNFIILPAWTSNPAPDPIFIFSGGPGGGSADWVDSYARRYEKLRYARDIVLVDQRGTGLSNPLPCGRIGDPNSAQTYLQDMFPEDYVTECRKELEKKANLYYYDSYTAMQDINELRAALGYHKVNIMGGSYGAYTGIVYLKYFPETVRSAVLGFAAIPNWGYPETIAPNTQTSLERLLADCAADPDCSADYPQLSQQLDLIIQQLKQGPVQVPIINPITGTPENVTFTHNNFIHGLRSMLYNVQGSKWIPAFIHWAANGNFTPLAEYTADYLYWINQDLKDGMFLCVTCTETIPYIDYESARAAAEGTFMGTYRLDQQKGACDLWVRGDHPDDFRTMTTIHIPTLIISAELDPVTPPRYSEELASFCPNNKHVIMPNVGHEYGQLWKECMDDVVAQFIYQGFPEGLDASCVNGNLRPPFVSWRDYESDGTDEVRFVSGQVSRAVKRGRRK